MSERRLQLRAMPLIVMAYLVAPLVVVVVLGLAWEGPWVVPDSLASQTWVLLLLFGVPACLVVELVVATPLLFGFSRWRWRWVNGWTACGLGLLVGFLPVFVADASGPVTGDVVNGVVFAANGVRTLAGWMSLAEADAPFGVAGFAAALVFRLIAIGTAPRPVEGGA